MGEALNSGEQILLFRIKSILGPVWLPAMLLAAAWASPAVISGLPTQMPLVLVLLAIITVLLALGFKRTQAAYAVVLIAITSFTVLTLLPGVKPDVKSGFDGQVVYAFTALLVPLNLALLVWLPNRSLTSLSGLLRLMAVLVQGLMLLILANPDIDIISSDTNPDFDRDLAGMLHWRLFPPAFDAWTNLPQPALILFAIALISTGARTVLGPDPVAIAYFAALIAEAAALHVTDNYVQSGLLHLAAIAIFLTALAHEAYRMSFRDELSGLANRRALDAMLSGLGGQYVIAMTDVDHFKKFNDTYGHDVGDQVLKMVAACLARVGNGGYAFRYGGEEFSLVFPNRHADEVWQTLEELREAVAASSFQLRGSDRPKEKPKSKDGQGKKAADSVSVTISIGVAEPQDRFEPSHAVIKQADEALYRAKKAGRNKVSK